MTACTYPALGLWLSGIVMGGIPAFVAGFWLALVLDARAQRNAKEAK